MSAIKHSTITSQYETKLTDQQTNKRKSQLKKERKEKENSSKKGFKKDK